MGEPIEDTVRKVAALARLELEPGEAAALGQQFERILAQFQVLAQAPVDGVEPMHSAARSENVLRADDPRPSLPVESALANAPARQGDFYAVPKTVGGDG